MEPVLTGLAVVAVVAGVLATLRRENRRRLRMWRGAAEACGLQDIRELQSFGHYEGVEGRAGDLNVHIESFKKGKSASGTRVRVEPLAAVADLRLEVESVGTTVRRGFGAREVELGDATFDGRFFIQGPPALAHAVLDADTRLRVWAVMKGRVAAADTPPAGELRAEARLDEGVLTLEFSEGWGSRLDVALGGALKTVLDTAQALARPRDVPRQLAANALADPLWAVRLGNLSGLAREFPDHPATRETLRAALGDASEEVRLRAATWLGGEGTATLVDLAGTAALDGIAGEAIRVLGPRLEAERVLAILAEAQRAGKPETARSCLEVLRVHPDAARSADVEPALLEIACADDELLRLLAARALGGAGSVSSIPTLQELAERFGGELRGAVRQAVAEIQSRLKGASPGQVSLSIADAGLLSITDEGRTGAVSLPGKDPGE
jgi:hypothetical protein